MFELLRNALKIPVGLDGFGDSRGVDVICCRFDDIFWIEDKMKDARGGLTGR